MKLAKIILEPTSGNIECHCALEVQAKVYTIVFTISEQELIARAIAEGRYSWDNIDVIALGEPIVGTDITY